VVQLVSPVAAVQEETPPVVVQLVSPVAAA